MMRKYSISLLILSSIVFLNLGCDKNTSLKDAKVDPKRLPAIVTDVQPTTGNPKGGTPVLISGNNIQPGAKVFFEQNECRNTVGLKPQQLSCLTPPHAAGKVALRVVNPESVASLDSISFAYQDAPSIIKVTPLGGAITGKTLLTVHGVGFLPGASVSLGDAPCVTVNVQSESTLTCMTPAHAKAVVDIVITNEDNQAGVYLAGYSYQEAPSVNKITPQSGFSIGGTPVVIEGTGFLSGAVVTLGGSACVGLIVNSPQSIRCVTTAHSQAVVAVDVTNFDSQSGKLPAGFAYQDMPTISSIVPSWGSLNGGTSVVLAGAGFRPGVMLSIGGASCEGVNVISSSSLSCVTSPHLESVVSGETITVTNADTQTSSGGKFRYVKLPAELSIGIKVWLKADSLALFDGDPVAKWLDSSKLGNDAGQFSLIKQPIFKLKILGGLPVVRFNGVANVLSITNTGIPSSFSLFVVAERVLTNSDMHLIEPDCGSNCEWVLSKNSNTYEWKGTSVVSPSFNTTNFNILYLDRTGTTGSVRINGSEKVSGKVKTGTGSQLIIGKRNVNNTEYLNGDIAEILIFNAELSDSDRHSMELYLDAKYGLGVL